MEARRASSALALVLDVVVNEKGVVEKLERGGGRQRVPQHAAEGATRRNQQRRAQALAEPGAKIPHRLIKMRLRLAVRQIRQQRLTSQCAIFRPPFEKGGSVHRRVRPSA
jgi:hypothetical protein